MSASHLLFVGVWAIKLYSHPSNFSCRLTAHPSEHCSSFLWPMRSRWRKSPRAPKHSHLPSHRMHIRRNQCKDRRAGSAAWGHLWKREEKEKGNEFFPQIFLSRSEDRVSVNLGTETVACAVSFPVEVFLSAFWRSRSYPALDREPEENAKKLSEHDIREASGEASNLALRFFPLIIEQKRDCSQSNPARTRKLKSLLYQVDFEYPG